MHADYINYHTTYRELPVADSTVDNMETKELISCCHYLLHNYQNSSVYTKINHVRFLKSSKISFLKTSGGLTLNKMSVDTPSQFIIWFESDRASLYFFLLNNLFFSHKYIRMYCSAATV